MTPWLGALEHDPQHPNVPVLDIFSLKLDISKPEGRLPNGCALRACRRAGVSGDCHLSLCCHKRLPAASAAVFAFPEVQNWVEL